MKKTLFTKDGKIDKDLTDEEIQNLADLGDQEAAFEVAKKSKATASTIEERLLIIEKFLGLI